MSRFADTFYFLALLNRNDHAHAAAKTASTGSKLLTTELVLMEVGDAMCELAKRPSFVGLVETLRSDTNVEILPATSELFQRGLDLFNRRPDKEWSMTDCTSFVVMQERGIAEALTGDHHFEQAGFTALLR